MAPDSFDSLASDVRHLEEDMACVKKDVREIRDAVLRADGGRRALAYLVTAAGSVGGIVGATAAYLGLR